MGAQQSSLDHELGHGGGEGHRHRRTVRFETHIDTIPSQFCLTDIAIECTSALTEDKGGLKLATLGVFGIGGRDEHSESYALLEVSPGRWIVGGSIRVPPGVKEIDYVITSDGGEDIGFAHLDVLVQPGGRLPDGKFSRQVELFDSPEQQLRISWKVVDVSSTAIAGVAGAESNEELVRHSERMFYQFLRTGSVAAISKAIGALQRVVDTAAESSPDLPLWFDMLGSWLLERFTLTGKPQDITRAVSLQQKALHMVPEGHSAERDILTHLGNSLVRRFESTGDLGDIAEAISVNKRALLLTPETHPDYLGRLSNLGSAFVRRYQRTGDLADLTEAISAHSRTVEIAPESHEFLYGMLSNLGVSFLRRFERTGDLEDITSAISVLRRAVRLTPQGHPDLSSRLSNLGGSLLSRFKRTGDLQDVAEAISMHVQAVHMTPEGHTALPNRLSSLGRSYLYRFKHTGSFQDVTEAISVHIQAVRLTPEGHAGLPDLLDDLGGSFLGRFDHTGDPQDVAEAILARSQAVRLTPEGHGALSSRLNNLGTAFLYRFQDSGDLDDVSEAISAHTQAVRLVAEDHPSLPLSLSNLGSSFQYRFQRTRNIPDITEAISCLEKAAHLTPEGHANRAGMLNNLGRSLQRRIEHTGDLEDAAKAISMQTQAVDITPEGHAMLPTYLHNLSTLFLCRFEITGDRHDVLEAISTQTQAVRLTPAGHADLSARLSWLGNSWYMSFISSNRQEDLVEAVDSLRLAATCSSGNPRPKILAAIRWSTVLDEHQPHNLDLLTAFETAMHLLTLLVGFEQTVQRRHTLIPEYGNLPLHAAATAFRLERPDKALEWLEQGRCLVWGQQSQLRTPLDELRLHDAALAESITLVSRQLENAGSASRTRDVGMVLSEKISLEDEAKHHLHLAREWDDHLKMVREIPGFEAFLQPSPFSTLVEYLPESGPVVVINVHDDRCDALGLLAGLDEPLHIPLPLFSHQKANEYRRALDVELRSGDLRHRGKDPIAGEGDGASGRALRKQRPRRPHPEAGIRSVLEGLWNEVIKPILVALGISKAEPNSSAHLPRIWWCPTGPLSSLPLHAAGIYNGPDRECIADYVVSSYTPTVTGLSRRVKDNRPIEGTVSGLFLTCQPGVPGAVSIPGTTKEVTSIHDKAAMHGIRLLKLEGDAVTPERCLHYMEEFSSIHLACHASQNAAEPLQSRFLFHRGNLSLKDIMQRDLKNADLAFLSACETGTGEETLSDEAVHLAAGMLAAGYRRVVATMWRIGDAHATQVAQEFYQYLWDHREESSGPTFDGTRSAYALHHATQRLREHLGNSDSSLLAWIPFVHFGY